MSRPTTALLPSRGDGASIRPLRHCPPPPPEGEDSSSSAAGYGDDHEHRRGTARPARCSCQLPPGVSPANNREEDTMAAADYTDLVAGQREYFPFRSHPSGRMEAPAAGSHESLARRQPRLGFSPRSARIFAATTPT